MKTPCVVLQCMCSTCDCDGRPGADDGCAGNTGTGVVGYGEDDDGAVAGERISWDRFGVPRGLVA